MKKVLLVLGALSMVISGVSAVSAYEAHAVNIKAHVENALAIAVIDSPVPTSAVFPEEWLLSKYKIDTSQSFCMPDQITRTWVDYKICVRWKEIMDVNGDPTGQYYHWLGEAVWLGMRYEETAIDPRPNSTPPGGDLVWVGANQTGPGGSWCISGLTGTLDKRTGQPNQYAYLWVGLDVPVFEGYYNPETDVPVKPSGRDAPSWVIPKKLPNGQDNPAWDPEGVDMGLDIIIQVTDIRPHDNTGADPNP